MLNHYVPRYYLKGFSIEGLDPPAVWVYDRLRRRNFRTQPKRVAAINNFYSDDTEVFLTESVEAPANRVLAKVRSRDFPLTADDKLDLAVYLAVMLMRTPSHQQRLQGMLPDVVESVLTKVNKDLDTLREADLLDDEICERLRVVAHRVGSQYVSADLPPEAWHDMFDPKVSWRVVALLVKMSWQFLQAPETGFFLTSDNPVYYDRGRGLRNPATQVSTPLSSDVALLASWLDVTEGTFPVDAGAVMEVNRRCVAAAREYVFAKEKKSWILKMIRNPIQRANILRISS